jgi:enamine deaminase RidA (YjgF/YER057c/UK114 family)
MTSFVHTNYPIQHPGVLRAENAAETFRQATSHFDGARAAATLLLAAVVSALLVVANQVIDTWTDGHLLAAWIALWAFGFSALALLTQPLRRAAAGAKLAFAAWAERRRQEAADQRLWDVALNDARVMAEINRAMTADAAEDVRSWR